MVSAKHSLAGANLDVSPATQAWPRRLAGSQRARAKSKVTRTPLSLRPDPAQAALTSGADVSRA